MFKLPPRDYLLKRLPHNTIKNKLDKHGFPMYCKKCLSERFVTVHCTENLVEQKYCYRHKCKDCGYTWIEKVDRFVWDNKKEKYVWNDKYRILKEWC